MEFKKIINCKKKSMIYILLFCNVLIGIPGLSISSEIINIPVLIYYDYPPFYIEKTNRGLGQELTEHLTFKAQGRCTFYLLNVPKGRVDKMLANPKWMGIVAWINPVFVNDKAMTKYIWSRAIMHEIDYVASLNDNPIEFKGLESLYGHIMGTVLNQRYADVEDALKSGKIKQVIVLKQESLVSMLLKRRIEFAFLSKSTLSWLKKEFPEFGSKIHLAKKVRNEFDRHILITPNMDKENRDFILKTVNNLNNDLEWKKRFDKY